MTRPEPISVRDLEDFVAVIQPAAVLRRKVGLNVRVGNHIAMPGGPTVEALLLDILARLRKDDRDAYPTHLAGVDWNRHHREAWIYGIVLGWDESLQEVAKKHGWPDKEVARLKRLREQFRAAAGE